MTGRQTQATASNPAVDEPAINFGMHTWSIRARLFSARVAKRTVVFSGGLFAIAGILALLSLLFGDYPLSLAELGAAVFGEADDFARVLVLDWRLPIAIASVLFGALLGVGGAIFQSLTRNPLGSPDVIGFDTGAYTAVVVTMLVIGRGSSVALASASLIGGLATAFIVFALANRGGTQGFRLIVIGIGVAAMLGAANNYLMSRASLEDAVTVGFWGAGSLSRVTWSNLTPTLLFAIVIVIATVLLVPSLQRLELGQDSAVTLGTRVTAAQFALMTTGVATTAIVTAVAGPIGFVALAAPQLAHRLIRTAGVSILGSAAMGAALLAAANLLALALSLLYKPVPVGLVTVCVGGLYLIWLLIREARKQFGQGAR